MSEEKEKISIDEFHRISKGIIQDYQNGVNKLPLSDFEKAFNVSLINLDRPYFVLFPDNPPSVIAVNDFLKRYSEGVISRLSMQEVLSYEIHSHWLASWIGFEWGQDLMGKYFAWKVRRKYNRYLVSLEERKRVLNGYYGRG